MAFSGINKQRFEILLGYSLPIKVIQEFFKRNKSALLLANFKVDNLPKSSDTSRLLKKCSEILLELPPKLEKSACEYFFPLVKTSEFESEGNDRPSIDSAILFFASYEMGFAADLAREDREKFSKYYGIELFRNLLTESPDPTVVRFLKTAIGVSNTTKFDGVADTQFLELIGELIELSKIEENLDIETLTDGQLMSLLLLGQKENEKGLKQEIERRLSRVLSDKERVLSMVDELLKFRNRVESSQDRGIVRIAEKIDSNTVKDLTDYEVIGIVQNIKEATSSYFIRPLAILKSDTFSVLTPEAALRLFPEFGSLLWKAKNVKRVLSERDIGLFTIKPDLSVGDSRQYRYLIDELQHELFRVIRCPDTSYQVEKVRNWFYANKSLLIETRGLVLFADSMIAKPNFKGEFDLDFDAPLGLFPLGELLQVGKDAFTANLGAAIRFLDISSPDIAFKRLIKSEFFASSRLSRQLLNDFSEELKAIEQGESASQIQFIQSRISEIILKEDVKAAILEDLFTEDALSPLIEKKVSELAELRAGGTRKLNDEIAKLESKRKELSSAIDREEKSQKQIKKEFVEDLRSAFDHAVKNGRKVLADYAIFQSLIDVRQSPLNGSPSAAPNNPGSSAIRVVEYGPDTGLSEKIAKSVRIGTALFQSQVSVLKVLQKCGFSFIFRGDIARLYARAIALRLNELSTREFFISPGITQAEFFSDDQFSRESKSGVLLHNFNIAPISLYAPQLIDHCLQRVLDVSSVSSNSIIFSEDESGVALDIPGSLNRCCIRLNVDEFTFPSEPISYDDFSAYIEERQLMSSRYREILTNVLRRIRDYPEQLDDQTLTFCFEVIKKGYVETLSE